MNGSVCLLCALITASSFGCNREASIDGTKSAPRALDKAASGTKPTKAAISRIVFVDQEKCCGCTRERIDKSWKALIEVVGYPPTPDVERLHMDSQAAEVAPYTKQKPIMVPPAIYFFDAQNRLVQVLQGEVEAEQIKKVLGTS
jgi:hypothetical protein